MRLSAVLLLLYALPLWAARLDGPFNLDDGVTFYVVNPDNAPFEVRVRWHDYRRESYPRPTLVRILDPAENLILRHEFAGEVTTPVPWDEETFSIPASGAGVYQVVVVGHSGGRVELVTEPELEFGVFGHLQWLCGAYEQFSDAYFYLPPGRDRLPVEVSKQIESLTIRDAAGAEALGEFRAAALLDLYAIGSAVGQRPVCRRGGAVGDQQLHHPVIVDQYR